MGKTPTHSLKWTSIQCICQLDTNYRYQFCLVWANVTWKNNCFFRKASSLRPGVLELLRIKFDAWQTPCDILHLPFPSERYVQSLDMEWSDPTTPVAASRSLVEAPSECFHESSPYGSIETSSLVWKATDCIMLFWKHSAIKKSLCHAIKINKVRKSLSSSTVCQTYSTVLEEVSTSNTLFWNARV